MSPEYLSKPACTTALLHPLYPTPPSSLPVSPAQVAATPHRASQQAHPNKPQHLQPVDLQRPLKRKWANSEELLSMQPQAYAPQTSPSPVEDTQRANTPRNPFPVSNSLFLETFQQQVPRLDPQAVPMTVTRHDAIPTPNQTPFAQTSVEEATVILAPVEQIPSEQALVQRSPSLGWLVDNWKHNFVPPPSSALQNLLKLKEWTTEQGQALQAFGPDEISRTQTASPETEVQIISRPETARKRKRIIDPYPPLQSSLAATHVMDSYNALFSSYDKDRNAKNFKARVEKGLKKMLADAPWYTAEDSNGYKSRNTSHPSSQTSGPQVLSPLDGPIVLPPLAEIAPFDEGKHLLTSELSTPSVLVRPGQGSRRKILQRRFDLLESTYACKLRRWMFRMIRDLHKESSTQIYDHFKHQLAFTPTGEVTQWASVAEANQMWRKQSIIRLHEISYGLLERIRAERVDEQEWEGVEEKEDSVDPTWRFRAPRTAWQDMAKFWKLLHGRQGAKVKKLWLPIVQIHYGLEKGDMRDPLAFSTPK